MFHPPPGLGIHPSFRLARSVQRPRKASLTAPKSRSKGAWEIVFLIILPTFCNKPFLLVAMHPSCALQTSLPIVCNKPFLLFAHHPSCRPAVTNPRAKRLLLRHPSYPLQHTLPTFCKPPFLPSANHPSYPLQHTLPICCNKPFLPVATRPSCWVQAICFATFCACRAEFYRLGGPPRTLVATPCATFRKVGCP